MGVFLEAEQGLKNKEAFANTGLAKALYGWHPHGESNPGRQLEKLISNHGNPLNNNMLECPEKSVAPKWTHSVEGNLPSEQKLQDGLKQVEAAWNRLPESIRNAIASLVAPYQTDD